MNGSSPRIVISSSPCTLNMTGGAVGGGSKHRLQSGLVGNKLVGLRNSKGCENFNCHCCFWRVSRNSNDLLYLCMVVFPK